jgi:hypothetical protein
MKKYYEHDHEVLILSNLMEYASRHRDFDSGYVEEVYNFLDKNRYITDTQLHELQKISSKIINKEFELLEK